MGFPEDVSLQAIETVGADIEAAVSWIIENPNGNDFMPSTTTMTTTATTTTTAAAAAASSTSSSSSAAAAASSQVTEAALADLLRKMMQNEPKMVVVVRQDLDLSAGKMASQCVHAALGVARQLRQTDPTTLLSWEQVGEKVVILRCKDQAEMVALIDKAKANSVYHHVVHDAGRTEVDPGTATVLAIGPAPSPQIDAITGHLRCL